MRSLVVCLLLAACVLECTARLQNITVEGITVCNKKRFGMAKVQLYEKDTFDPDDLLATKNPDAEGEFWVYGEEDETHAIVPYLLITHKCNPSKPNCVRIGKYLVPEDKIGGTYDMTYVTLDIKVHGEKEKCTQAAHLDITEFFKFSYKLFSVIMIQSNNKKCMQMNL